MPDPLVSVVIPVFNRAELVVEAVGSVLAQTVKDIEAIVVDDGSTDGTAQAVDRIGDPRVVLLRKEHSGIAATRNAGISRARGMYLAFLDSDDLWIEAKLEKQLPLFKPGVGFVYGRFRSVRDGVALRSKPVGGPSGMIFEKLLKRIFVQMSTAVVSREAARAAGPLDESLKYSDEYEWFLRLAERYPCGFVDEDVVLYRIHGGNESRNALIRVSENLEVYRRFHRREDISGGIRRLAGRRVARYAGQLGDMLLAAGDASGALEAYREGLAVSPWSLRLVLKAGKAARAARPAPC